MLSHGELRDATVNFIHILTELQQYRMVFAVITRLPNKIIGKKSWQNNSVKYVCLLPSTNHAELLCADCC